MDSKEKIQLQLFKNSWEALAGYRRRAIFLVCLYGFSGLLEGVVLLTLIPIFQSGTPSAPGNQKLTQWLEALSLNPDNLLFYSLTAFIVIGFLSATVMVYSESALLRLKTRLEESLRKKLSGALLRMNWSAFHSMRLGDINKAILVEPSHAAQGAWYFLSGVGALIIAGFFSITALFISVKMTLITISFVAVVALGYRIVEKKALKHARHWTESGTSIGNLVSDIFGNLKFFRSTGCSIPAEKKINVKYDEHEDSHFRSHVYNLVMRFAYQVGSVIFLGGLLAFFLLFYKLPLAELVVLLAVFYRMVPRLRSVQEQFYQARAFQEWYLTWKKRYDYVASHQETNTGNLKPKFENSLQIQNLGFSYPNLNRPVLQGINFTLKKNQCIAIVGESGGGKSTLVDLITGLLKPSDGSILLDDVSLNDVNINEWRLKIGLVIQESPIFHTTVLENIAWGYDAPDPELAKRCAQLAHAWEFIANLPEGLNTVVGEKGGRFSVGQKQRVALARALYRDPSLLVLDEATSALDGESEKIIQESLKSLKGKFAIFMVAHRLKTIQIADTIIVLGEGKILEKGTWSELINKPSGTFRKMAELQGLVNPSNKMEPV